MHVMPVGGNWSKTGLGGWDMRRLKFSERAGCYPCSNFSDTSSVKLLTYPFVLHEISVLIELTLGHLRYHLTDVLPQANSQPDSVFNTDQPANGNLILKNKL